MKIKLYILIIISIFSSPYIVFAQKQDSKIVSELTVEADESIEWFEKDKYYVAKGNVILKKDGFTLNANFVRANYKIKNGENVLEKIIARENITFTKKEMKATGQNLIYEFNDKIAILSGKFQTLTTTSGYVESNKKIKFDDLKNKAEAEGKVKIILSNKTIIRADKINADLNNKDKSVEYAIAKGNVLIENNKDKGNKSQAQLGIYNSSNEIIKLSGNVVLTTAESILMGSKGQTNLKTGISTLISNPRKKRGLKALSLQKKIKKWWLN